MSDPQTHEDLWTQFMEGWDTFNSEWSAAWKHCTDIIDGALNSVGQVIDDILPGTNEAEHALDKWNNEIAPALNDGYDQIWDQVIQMLGDLAGRPLALQAFAETFASAKGKIYVQRSYEEADAALAGSWSGAAHDAYVPVAAKQYAALKQLGDALDQGGMLTSAAAAKILQVWADLIYQFASFYADLISTLSGALTVEDVLTFGAKGLLALVAAILKRITEVAKVLATFFVTQTTTDGTKWVSLAAGSGSLPGNEWPPIPEASSDSINQPGGWG